MKIEFEAKFGVGDVVITWDNIRSKIQCCTYIIRHKENNEMQYEAEYAIASYDSNGEEIINIYLEEELRKFGEVI